MKLKCSIICPNHHETYHISFNYCGFMAKNVSYFVFLWQLIIKEIKKEMKEILPLLSEIFVVHFINFGTTVQR